MYRIIDDWMIFNYRFNKPLSNVVFPMGIQKVKFGPDFDQDVSKLPNSITHLTFGDRFNQVVNQLPNSLIHLKFGYNFNQDVSNATTLPKSITYLYFSLWHNSKFNQPLNPYMYHLTEFNIKDNHKHRNIMLARCQINQHNGAIRNDKLIDLLLKK